MSTRAYYTVHHPSHVFGDTWQLKLPNLKNAGKAVINLVIQLPGHPCGERTLRLRSS